MNKIIKETIKTAKGLQRKGIIYLDDSIDIGAEANYQVIAAIVVDLNILMDEEKYEALKSDKEKLLQEIVLSSSCEDDLIYGFSDDFKMHIIKQFIDLENPELIWGTYCFITNFVKLQELHEKALIQIKEEKFLDF
ncbi:MAG: hypothetical protein H7Y18_04800 [Clostridiaceae bacterium]|nr:hypothetical protein [Clostridiaceae bacterium]